MTTIIDRKNGFNPNVTLPAQNDAKVWFTDDENGEHIGIWIEPENMFYIGFANSGDFRYKFEVKAWGYLPEDFRIPVDTENPIYNPFENEYYDRDFCQLKEYHWRKYEKTGKVLSLEQITEYSEIVPRDFLQEVWVTFCQNSVNQNNNK